MKPQNTIASNSHIWFGNLSEGLERRAPPTWSRWPLRPRPRERSAWRGSPWPKLKNPIPNLTRIFQPNHQTLESSFSCASKPILHPNTHFQHLFSLHHSKFKKHFWNHQNVASVVDFFVKFCLLVILIKSNVLHPDFDENLSGFYENSASEKNTYDYSEKKHRQA